MSPPCGRLTDDPRQEQPPPPRQLLRRRLLRALAPPPLHASRWRRGLWLVLFVLAIMAANALIVILLAKLPGHLEDPIYP